MRFNKPGRLVAVAALMGSVGVGTIVAMTGPAAAAFPANFTCKHITGNIAGNITVTGCTASATGGSSMPFLATALSSGGTIPWTNGKTTTIGMPTITPIKASKKCKAGNTNESFKAPVTADTTGLTTLGFGTGAVCITPTGAITASKPLKVT